jgi:hypothetical protein
LPKPEFLGPAIMDEAGAASAVLLRDVHCALLRAYQVLLLAVLSVLAVPAERLLSPHSGAH